MHRVLFGILGITSAIDNVMSTEDIVKVIAYSKRRRDVAEKLAYLKDTLKDGPAEG